MKGWRRRRKRIRGWWRRKGYEEVHASDEYYKRATFKGCITHLCPSQKARKDPHGL